MTVLTQSPREVLRPFVKQFVVVEFRDPVQDFHFPGTGLFAAFPFRGECRLPDGSNVPEAALTGLCDKLRHHAHSKDNAVVVVAFTPTGAAAFLRHPLDELRNRTVALSELVGKARSFARLGEQLAEDPNHLRRVRRVEDLLLAHLNKNGQPDLLVAAAVKWIECAPAGARIDQLVRHIGLSQSALERRFRRVVGTSPKRFATLVRLENIARLHASGASFTAIAHAAGYFDQAHFNHDFSRVTGVAPEAFFRPEIVG